MAFVTERKHPTDDVLSLLPVPLYTQSRIYYEEDLEELGLTRALNGLSNELRQSILNHAARLTQIQPELAFHFLLRFPKVLEVVREEDLDQWVRVALDIYDAEGLIPARDFVTKLDKHPAFNRFWGKGTGFRETSGVLLNYLHALGKQEIGLEAGSVHYTDVTKIYVPERIALFQEKAENFLLYKVMVTHKFAQLHLGTYRLSLSRLPRLQNRLRQLWRQPDAKHLHSDLSRFLHLFPDPTLARDLFVLIDSARIEAWIADNLPGLFRDLKALKRRLASEREMPERATGKALLLEKTIRWWLSGEDASCSGIKCTEAFREIKDGLLRAGGPGITVDLVAHEVAKIYPFIEQLSGPYEPVEVPLYIGELRPEEAEQGRRRRRESTRLAFRQELAKLLEEPPEGKEIKIELPGLEDGTYRDRYPQRQEIPRHLLIDGNPVPLPEALQRVIEEIYEDLGSIPTPYLAMTNDMSGHYFRPLYQMPEGTGYVLSEHGEGIYALDEWDYRRRGYRKRWALLRESDAPAGSTAFAEEVLEQYRGMIHRIKRQFERIRMEHMLLRRQKEGDNVDFDAAVEAFSDQRAGLYPSERVFVRLRRNKRDISTAFLIDLSGSTSGWINEMARAALLILSEAMQVLQDRFAIYGFSGRTRKRCELFRVKAFDEVYGETVKRRIGSLEPREYTRMGPPIRRVSKILTEMESRTKLLITLSDGKPDDWDAYNGEYGIEDTRQALLEAKRKGIHPFCITIDKAEHGYLSHMYGAVNYAFIDNLSKLPVKIPEIYRKLTT